jgi:hypothetical protein
MAEPKNPELSARNNSAVATEPTPRTESEKKLGHANIKGVRGQAFPAESKAGGDLHKKTSADDRKIKVQRGDTKSDTAAITGAASTTVDGKPKPSSPNKSKPNPSATSTRPAPIATTKASATTKPAMKPIRSPAPPRTPTTPVRMTAATGKTGKPVPPESTASSNPTDASKASDHKSVKPSVGHSSIAKSNTQPGVASGSAAIKKSNQTTSNNAFHKPRPKSPTKPVKLPSSMTAPTASSLSKVSPASPPSRQAHRLAQGYNANATSRPPSRTNLASNTELRRKSSSLNDRPALGRPPASSSVRRQSSRQSLSGAPASDGFLARMMRPTTSSASKTNEKVVTPPRSKSSTRPTTRDGPGHQKTLEGHKGSPQAKKHVKAAKLSKVEDSKVEEPHNIGYSETGKSDIVAQPVVENGHAEPTSEGKSKNKDSSEHLRTGEEAESAEPSAVKEPTEPTATSECSVKEEAIPENSEIAPEPNLSTLAIEDKVIPDNIGVTPETEPATQTTEEPIPKEQKVLDIAEESNTTGVVSEEALTTEQTHSTEDASEQLTEDAID